jgi:hypothetical protein
MDDIHTVPAKLLLDAPTDVLQLIQESVVVPFYKDTPYRRVALVKVLQSMTRTPQSLIPDAVATIASPHNSGLPTITEIAVQSAELCQEMVDGKEKSFMGYTFICKARDERWTVSDWSSFM